MSVPSSASSVSSKPSRTPASVPAAPTSADPAAAASGSGKKELSAKELKKASRAAKVAARATGVDPTQITTGSPVGSTLGAAAAANSSSSGGPPGAAAAAGSSSAPSSGPSRHRRPTGVDQHPQSATSIVPATASNQFFSHLPAPRGPGTPAALTSAKLHPVIVRLGVLIASGTLRGASARTVGVLEAFREVVRDYECPDTAVFWKDLSSHISPMIAYLETCRPKGVGVGNAIRWFKGEINRLGDEEFLTEAEQKARLVDAIGVYLRDRIEVAGQAIADYAKEKIKPGDTVVVYARSSVVELVLLEAWRDMRARTPSTGFSVVVVDSRPLHEGRELLASLSAAGLPCTYTLLPLASTALSRASLVLLGGSSLNSDGALHSRAGTAVVAMLAKEHRVPVVACIEMFKLSERVLLDGLASNELGDTDILLSIPITPALEMGSLPKPNLTPLHLMYDLTPPSLITAVCTEIGFIPPTSVPTLLSKSSMAA